MTFSVAAVHIMHTRMILYDTIQNNDARHHRILQQTIRVHEVDTKITYSVGIGIRNQCTNNLLLQPTATLSCHLYLLKEVAATVAD